MPIGDVAKAAVDPYDAIGAVPAGDQGATALTPEQVLAVMAIISQGAGYEPTIGSAVTQRITLDEGSDIDHAELLFTFNAGPVGDIAIASQRFQDADSNAQVIKTLITGATAAGGLFSFYFPNGLTNAFLARNGESSYSQAAGATITAAQAVMATWDGALGLKYCTVNVGGPYVGAGSNNRYRDIVITGYSGV